MQETQETLRSVSSLGRSPEVGNVFLLHSSILTWKILLTEEPGGSQYMGSQNQTPLTTECVQGKVPFSFSYYRKTKPSIHCGNITCTHSQILLYANIVSGGLVLSSSGLLGDMSPIKAPTAGSPNWISLLHCISSPCTSLEHLLK